MGGISDDICIDVICLMNSHILKRFESSATYMPPNTDMLIAERSFCDSDPSLIYKLPPFVTFCDQIWWWRDIVYALSAMKQLVLQKCHDTPLAGHWGSFKNCGHDHLCGWLATYLA